MTDYKPGTIAKATVRGVPDVTVTRQNYRPGHAAHSVTFEWFDLGSSSWVLAADVTDVRPLVVLDLHAANPDGNPEILLENTLRALRKYGTVGTRGIANQIEAQARPAIEEPKGLGAVVEDTDGVRWVRLNDDPELNKPWRQADLPAIRANWTIVDAVRVLSPGVES